MYCNTCLCTDQPTDTVRVDLSTIEWSDGAAGTPVLGQSVFSEVPGHWETKDVDDYLRAQKKHSLDQEQERLAQEQHRLELTLELNTMEREHQELDLLARERRLGEELDRLNCKRLDLEERYLRIKLAHAEAEEARAAATLALVEAAQRKEAKRRSRLAAQQPSEAEALSNFLTAHQFSGVNARRRDQVLSFTRRYRYPLHVAVELCDVAAVRLLLHAHADPSLRNFPEGETPQRLTARLHKEDAVVRGELLRALQTAECITSASASGKTPRSMAQWFDGR